MSKYLVLMLVALMAFAGIAAADDIPYIVFGANPTMQLFNSSTNTSILINATYRNMSTGTGDDGMNNISACTLYLSPNNVLYWFGPVNTTNSTGLTLGSGSDFGTSFNFIIANTTVGALAERGRLAPWNVTVNCSFINGTGTFNITNTTALTIDITAPVITPLNLSFSGELLGLNHTTSASVSCGARVACYGFNASQTSITFVVTDTGSNVSNCSLWVSSVNTTYSNSPSLAMNQHGFSPILGSRGNVTYTTTQNNTLGTPASIKEATHQLIVQCADYAGNFANSTNWSYVVANGTVPVNVSLDSPAANADSSTSVPVAFKFTPYNPFIANCTLNISNTAGNTTVTSITAGLTLANATQSTIWSGAAAGVYNWSMQCVDLGGHLYVNNSQRAITFTAASGGESSSSGGTYTPQNIKTVCGDAGGYFTNDAHTTWVCTEAAPPVEEEPAAPLVCTTSDPCKNAVESNGQCVYNNVVDGTACGTNKECKAGSCVTITVQPPAPPPVTPAVTEADAQTAMSAATSAVNAAAAAGKGTAEAQAKLAEAQIAFDLGDYALAISLFNEAKSLAQSAAPLAPVAPVEPTEPVVPAPVAPTPPAQEGGIPWLLIIVVIVIIAAVAYFMTRKKY